MKEMSKIDFSKFKKGTILLEVQCLRPERFINILWQNGIYVKDIKRINITTVHMVVKLKDYPNITYMAKRTNTKIKILKRQGIDFFLIKKSKVTALILGTIIFLSIMYYLSTFVWKINIYTERYLSPYEVRNELINYGINVGTKKSQIQVHKLEDRLLKDNDNIMWVKARIEGVNLNIHIFENQSPPEIVKKESANNLIASKDGEVVRVYTKSGKAVVDKGKIVKKGDLLVKGEQGNEEQTYEVNAIGEVIAKTFYEKYKEVPIKIKKRERTGNQVEKVYVVIKGKKIYLKNGLNKFYKYDKIVNKKGFINKEIYYEVKEKEITRNKEQVVKQTVNLLTKDITKDLDKTVKIVNKVVDTKVLDNKYGIRLLLIAEENIAVPESVQNDVNKDK